MNNATTKENGRGTEGARTPLKPCHKKSGLQQGQFAYIGKDFAPFTALIPHVGAVHFDGRDAEVLAAIKAAGLWPFFEHSIAPQITVSKLHDNKNGTVTLFMFIGVREAGGFQSITAPDTPEGRRGLWGMASLYYEPGVAEAALIAGGV